MTSYLLDTNALSELIKPSPDMSFMKWFNSVNHSFLYTSSIVIGEIIYGIELTQNGDKKDTLSRWMDTIIEVYDDRILSFEIKNGIAWGKLAAGSKKTGQPKSVIDTMLASQAQSANMTLVTRNSKDFEHIENLLLLNPWSTQ